MHLQQGALYEKYFYYYHSSRRLWLLPKEKKEHRHHEAHVHGGATLNIAFDQLKGKVEFKAASAGVVGFEHLAKTEKDKKTVTEAKTNMDANIAKLFSLIQL